MIYLQNMIWLKWSIYIVILLPANCRDSNTSTFKQISFNMKIAKKSMGNQSPLVSPKSTWKSQLRRFSKKGECIAIKYHNTTGDNNSGSYEINLPYYGAGSAKEWLVWKDRLLKGLDGKNISTWPLRYTFTKQLLIGIEKATFNKTTLDIGIVLCWDKS